MTLRICEREREVFFFFSSASATVKIHSLFFILVRKLSGRLTVRFCFFLERASISKAVFSLISR